MLGENIADHVELLEVAPLYRCFFQEDASFVDISKDEKEMRRSVESIDPLAWPSFVEYMKVAKGFLDFGLPTVIQERLTLKGLPEFIAACVKSFPLRSHSNMLRDFFPESPKMRAILSFQDLVSEWVSNLLFSALFIQL